MFKKTSTLIILCAFFPLFCMQLELSQLSLEKKIGQLFMVTAVSDEETAQECIKRKSYRIDKDYVEELIRTYHIGGIIYLGKSSLDKQIKRTHYFQSISSIPLLIGQDLEPGRVGASHLPHDFNFPSNQVLGAEFGPKYTKKYAKIIGDICKKLGVHINFAPVVDVNNNPDNPVINDRSFSDDSVIVANNGIAFAQGLKKKNIAACAKHFPGHGDTTIDSHFDLPIINHDRERLDIVELYPFKQLIAQKIPAIMIGHLCLPALEPEKNLPATFSKAIVTDLLQKELGFSGVIVTDGLDMGAITKHYSAGQAALKALMAGNDILLCSTDVPAAVLAIKQAVIDGIITEQDIDTHIEKILEMKRKYVIKTGSK